MAETFRNRIDALTGFAVINGTDSDDAISDWLTDGLKQIINILPPARLTECVVIGTLNNSPTTFNLNTATNGKPISVTREDAQGIKQPCREISPLLSTRITDENDIMHASTSDPVYYISSATLNVYPTPTATQNAEVLYVPSTAVVHSGTSGIDNFPNDLEYIVVLYASIKAAQSLLALEEDDDLYVPMITSLKQDYVQAINLLGAKQEAPKEASTSKKQIESLQKLLAQGQ